jgi:soluble lytic murein transglycosylase-like protein
LPSPERGTIRPLRPRLTLLFLVAVAAGTVAGFVGNATAGKGERSVNPGRLRPPLSLGRCPIPDRYRAAFVRAAHETHLPLAMLTAVAQIESQFVEDARSPAGAHGLFQLLPSTAAELQLDPYEPTSNVLAGARYLRKLLDRFDSTELALAAYNAGPDAVEKAGGAPSATRDYVTEVTRLWRALNGCR